MRSPERARRLFDTALDDTSSPTPPPRSNDSNVGSIHSYSSGGGSSSKSSASSSGQKRSRRASGLSSPEATTRKAAATDAHGCDRPSSPRVNKALFMDAVSSDDEQDDQSGDDGERISRHDSVCSNAGSGNKENQAVYQYKALCSKTSSKVTKDVTPPRRPQRAVRRRPRSPLAMQESVDAGDHPMRSTTPAKGRRRSPAASTTAAIGPAFCSPALQSAASRKLRAAPGRHPLISPFVKGSEADSAVPQVPRSKAISSVPTSPLHSPTTAKLSNHMDANLSMKSPVQQVPRTPQKSSSVTPCKSPFPVLVSITCTEIGGAW